MPVIYSQPMSRTVVVGDIHGCYEELLYLLARVGPTDGDRVISVGVMGLSLTIAGAIGWDVSQAHGLFQGMKWVDGPIWWQIGLGGALLALAVLLARRMPPHATRSPVVQ